MTEATYLFPYVGSERKRERPKPDDVPQSSLSDDFCIRLIKEVCRKHEVTIERVRAKDFHPKLLLARRECVRRLRDELGLSWRRIGSLMHRDRKACACLWDRVHGERQI